MSRSRQTQRTPLLLAFSLRVDARGMQVHLVRQAHAPLEGLETPAVLSAMKAEGLVVPEGIEPIIAQAVAQWRANPAQAGEVLLAQADPPEDGRDGQIVWSPDCRPPEQPDHSAEVDFYTARLVTLAAGTVIARVEPPTPGEPGRDVRGSVLAARAGRAATIKAGPGCHLDRDSATLVADRAGVLHVSGQSVSVSELMEIRGNVDFSTGHLRAPNDVVITGDVADLFEVVAKGDVAIGGEVNAARVLAGGDVEIRRALVNRRKGLCAAGGQVRVGLVDNSVLIARGDVQVAKEAVQSDLFAGGAIQCNAMRGGVAVACGGLAVRLLGSPGVTRTLVIAGVDWMLAPTLRPWQVEIEALQAELAKLLPALKTLRENVRRLSAAQKAQVSELESAASQRASRLSELEVRLDEARRASRERCRLEVLVRGQIYTGVELRLGPGATTTTMAMAGPVTFRLAGSSVTPTVVAEEPGGRPLPLPTRRLRDPLEGVVLPEMPPEPTAAKPDQPEQK